MELPSNLSIDNIQPVYQELAQHFDEVDCLDFSGVDFLDTAGIQMILTFVLSKVKREQSIKLVNVSNEYQEKLKGLGLWEHFETKIG